MAAIMFFLEKRNKTRFASFIFKKRRLKKRRQNMSPTVVFPNCDSINLTVPTKN